MLHILSIPVKCNLLRYHACPYGALFVSKLAGHDQAAVFKQLLKHLYQCSEKYYAWDYTYYTLWMNVLSAVHRKQLLKTLNIFI